ncbi:hypothetical protein BDZ45DRAFT_668383 [Acephala macrosclerotiorum]|nr:hypothetical protein BDZ45DRAFT_668383 [Acephala macrosclerotiorum]
MPTTKKKLDISFTNWVLGGSLVSVGTEKSNEVVKKVRHNRKVYIMNEDGTTEEIDTEDLEMVAPTPRKGHTKSTRVKVEFLENAAAKKEKKGEDAKVKEGEKKGEDINGKNGDGEKEAKKLEVPDMTGYKWCKVCKIPDPNGTEDKMPEGASYEYCEGCGHAHWIAQNEPICGQKNGGNSNNEGKLGDSKKNEGKKNDSKKASVEEVVDDMKAGEKKGAGGKKANIKNSDGKNGDEKKDDGKKESDEKADDKKGGSSDKGDGSDKKGNDSDKKGDDSDKNSDKASNKSSDKGSDKEDGDKKPDEEKVVPYDNPVPSKDGLTWTEQQDASIIMMKMDKSTWNQIASAVGASKSEVQTRFKELQAFADDYVTAKFNASKGNYTKEADKKDGTKKNDDGDKVEEIDPFLAGLDEVLHSMDHRSGGDMFGSPTLPDKKDDKGPKADTGDFENHDANAFTYEAPGGNEGNRAGDYGFKVPNFSGPQIYGKLKVDASWGKEDCDLLEYLLERHESEKWLHMQASFYNYTGRMVAAEFIEKKFKGDGAI